MGTEGQKRATVKGEKEKKASVMAQKRAYEKGRKTKNTNNSTGGTK